MKVVDVICWILLIIGGLNWGLVGVAQFDVIAAIFGAGSGLAKLSYILIGLAGIYSIWRWCGCKSCSK